MIKGSTVEITLRDSQTGEYLRIPVVPQVIEGVEGTSIANTVQVLQLGAVDFPNGAELDAVTWESFFPVRYDTAYCAYSDLRPPTEYRDLLTNWKNRGTSLQLIIPTANINKTMRVEFFSWEIKGFEGDLHYEVTFKQVRTIRPVQIALNTTEIDRDNGLTPEARPPLPDQPRHQTYTVQPGDTLAHVAKKNGTNWQAIYDNNRDTIGPNPNNIQPGQVLTL